MSKWKHFLLALTIVLIVSCTNDDRMYEDFKRIPTSNWGMTDSLHFDLSQVEWPASQHLIAVKYNEEYAFSNCYIRVISRDSLDSIIDNKLINLHLFDPKTGEPLGEGFGSSNTRYDTLPFGFPLTTKSVTLLQYMRQEKLPGVEAVGLKMLR